MISSIRNQIHKFITYYNSYGLLWLCRHVITNLVHYEKTLVLESEINEKYEKIEAKIPIIIRLLNDNEKDIYDVAELFREYNPVRTLEACKYLVKEHLKAGDRCMVAEYYGKIIHMNWFGFQDAHLFESFEKKRGIGPGEVLSHNTICAKKYRNNGLMTAVRSEVFNYLANNGYIRLINNVDHNNEASSKVTKRFGAKAVGEIYSLKILGINIDIYNRYKNAGNFP